MMPLRRSKRLAAAASTPDAPAAAAPPPSLDELPDDLVLKLEPHLREVLVPDHLVQFASTSKAARQLLAERLAALKKDRVIARALLVKCGLTVETIVRDRPSCLQLEGLVPADVPVLGQVLCIEATAQLKVIYFDFNPQLGAGAATAITAAVAGGGLKRLRELFPTQRHR